MDNIPKLSVCMITYNHESFIKQAIESILMQITTFDFNVVIANDRSKDQTDLVIQELIESHPKGHLITYFNHKENKGMYDNFIFALAGCKGEFVALCEGDDYWTDPYKLQKQVDFLEAHPEFEVCFTNMQIVDSKGEVLKEKLITDDRKDVYERKHLPIWAPTLTRVFRNRDFTTVPSAPGLDTIMLLWQSQYGKIKFLDEVTGVYRMHDGGIYSANSEAKRLRDNVVTHIKCMELVETRLYRKYLGILLKKILLSHRYGSDYFKETKKLVADTFRVYKTSCSFFLRFKFRIGLLMVSFPNRTSWYKSMVFGFINKFFIYGL